MQKFEYTIKQKNSLIEQIRTEWETTQNAIKIKGPLPYLIFKARILRSMATLEGIFIMDNLPLEQGRDFIFSK